MRIWNYNPVTGVLIGASEADESPLEPGVYMVPAYATEISPPPLTPEGEETYWAGDAWATRALPPPPPPPTTAEYVAVLRGEVQSYLEAIARDWGFDSMLDAVSYVDEPTWAKGQVRGRALRTWRSQVWLQWHTVARDIERGVRLLPRADDLIAELPAVPALPN